MARLTLALLFFLSVGKAFAQDTTQTSAGLLRLGAEDMMSKTQSGGLDASVSIASKRRERIFDAPFSVSVITKEDIQRAGVTTIMEAFRLVPGLLVFEQTNGNFDIHIRGGNNVQQNTVYSTSSNTTTLVMIDSRPIYNYFQGGTLWETIPIDLNDVERIELVRGATSAMYGPNAVSGVINIITRNPLENELYAVANAQHGDNGTSVANLSLGYKFGKAFDMVISANSQRRERTQNSYYSLFNYDFSQSNVYLPRDSMGVVGGTPALLYEEVDLAMEKYGVNAFFHYSPNDNTDFSLSLGGQDSKVQKVYSENLTSPLNTSLSNSYYADFGGRIGQLTTQLSYAWGTQTEGTDPAVNLKWDFSTIDALAEYELIIGSLRLKPGVNFRSAAFDDSPYYDETALAGFLNERQSITTFAAYLRADYLLMAERLRLIGAFRFDRFNFQDSFYPSYQVGANFKIDDRNIIRANASRATRSPNILELYHNRDFSSFGLIIIGNENIELLTSTMLEIGYRSKISDHLQLDLEMFRNERNNYTDFIEDFNDAGDLAVQQIQNVPLETRQIGITASISYRTPKLSIAPFLSYQSTSLLNSSLYPNSSNAPPIPGNNNDPGNFNINSGIGTTIDHEGTPLLYGGMVVNYAPNRQWNLNMSMYSYAKQYYYYYTNYFFNDGVTGQGQVNGKTLINATVSFKPTPNLTLFGTAKNLLADDANEYYFTDRIGTRFLAGLHFNY